MQSSNTDLVKYNYYSLVSTSIRSNCINILVLGLRVKDARY